jgi:Ca2+-binding EF-hand superfamily protein
LEANDAFRAMDNDFDGFISKEDLTNFLLKILHLSPKVATSQVIDRLFKLMDQFKRGCI